MKILLAGYNLDYDLIRTLKDKSGLKQDLTPETISAAYARISRSPKTYILQRHTSLLFFTTVLCDADYSTLRSKCSETKHLVPFWVFNNSLSLHLLQGLKKSSLVCK